MISSMAIAQLINQVKICDVDGTIPLTAVNEYVDQLTAHCEAVYRWGIKLGVDERQLSVHDDSKWSLEEFIPFLRWHMLGDKSDPMAYQTAFHLHQNRNPHHWHYWVCRHGVVYHGVKLPEKAFPMPYPYILEMVADWCGAAEVRSGVTGGINNEWLIKNFWRMTLHSLTRDALMDILPRVGGDVEALKESKPPNITIHPFSHDGIEQRWHQTIGKWPGALME